MISEEVKDQTQRDKLYLKSYFGCWKALVINQLQLLWLSELDSPEETKNRMFNSTYFQPERQIGQQTVVNMMK